ncbi:Xaa-Pro peptidase family protein [bacterium]|nr:Xaa-Pro peptidase family protein [bacterium]
MNQIVEVISTPPTSEELESRLKKVRLKMEQEGLDYYISAHTDNVYYLTNFAYFPLERPFFLVIPKVGKLGLILPLLEISHAEQRILQEVDYHTYFEYPAPKGVTFADVLKKVVAGDKRVGFETSLPFAMKEALPGKLKAVDIIDDVRLVKSDYEIGRIAYASKVVDVGHKKLLELAKPGVPQVTLYSDATKEMIATVLFEVPDVNMLMSKFVAAVWPKALSAQPHSIPGLFDNLQEGGPNVSIVTTQANGYSAEVERTFFLGQASDEDKKLFDLCMKARQKAYEIIKPGIRADEVDEIVLNIIKKAGYEKNILHRTGHGFGITGHEPPWVALGSEHILEKNMVISIEPGIYVEGQGGYRHSDTVLITENGCQSLTRTPDKIEDLILDIG